MKKLIVLMVLFYLGGNVTSCTPEALSDGQKTTSPYGTGDEPDDPVEPDREDG